jgi:hypothetical protein
MICCKQKNKLLKFDNLNIKQINNLNYISLKFCKFISISILSLFVKLLPLFKPSKIKVALCTMGREENLYVKEFVFYYKKLGIDKIFIYDDNELNTERIKDANPLFCFNLLIIIVIVKHNYKSIKALCKGIR